MDIRSVYIPVLTLAVICMVFLFWIGMSIKMVFYIIILFVMGMAILCYGLLGFIQPRKLAKVSEQFDALGSQTTLSSIEPTRLNVKITKISSVMAILIGLFILAIVIGSIFIYL